PPLRRKFSAVRAGEVRLPAEPGRILLAEARGAPRRRQTELVLANRVQRLRPEPVADGEPAHLVVLRLSPDVSHSVAEEQRRTGVAQALAVDVGGRAEVPRPPHLDRPALELIDETDARDRDERRRAPGDRGPVAEEVVHAGRADAPPRHALVLGGGGVAVVAGGSVRAGRIRAFTGRRIAGARVVALVLGGADDGVAAGARAALAGVGLRAGGAVGARRRVRLGGVGAGGVAVAGAGLAAVVGRRAGEGRAAARAARADIVLGARVAVVAGRAVRLGGVGAGAVAVAGAGLMALVGRRAGEGRAAARAARADVVIGAGVAVVAHRPVGCCRVRAHATRRVARAGDVALIERRAGDGGGRASAGAVLARLPARAGVVVVAGGPVRDRRVLTSRDRVARVGGARVAVVARWRT